MGAKTINPYCTGVGSLYAISLWIGALLNVLYLKHYTIILIGYTTKNICPIAIILTILFFLLVMQCVANMKCGSQEVEDMLTSSEAGSGQVSMTTSTVHSFTLLTGQLIPNHCTRLHYYVHLCDLLICSILNSIFIHFIMRMCSMFRGGQ